LVISELELGVDRKGAVHVFPEHGSMSSIYLYHIHLKP